MLLQRITRHKKGNKARYKPGIETIKSLREAEIFILFITCRHHLRAPYGKYFYYQRGEESNLPESRFKNSFKEISGFTPVDYVQRERVDYAVRKIREDDGVSLKDMTYELNFSSQQYFSAVVKKFTGKSPKELR